MGRHCAAYGCANNSTKESCKRKNISFHSFPIHDPPRLQKWLVNLRRKDFAPSSYSAVCSVHFNEKDFLYQSFTKTRLLKRDAVPAAFPRIPDEDLPTTNATTNVRTNMERRKNTPTYQGKNIKSLIGKTEKKCNKCGFVTFSLHVLYNHKYKCTGQLLGKPIFCLHCKRKFSFLVLYRTHHMTCVKRVSRKRFLKSKIKHKDVPLKKKSKDVSDKYSFSCPICRTSFKSKLEFVSHLKQQNCTSSPKTVKTNSHSARKSFGNHKNQKGMGLSNEKTQLSTEEDPCLDFSLSDLKEKLKGEMHLCSWCKNTYPSEQLLFSHLKMNEQCAVAYYQKHVSSFNNKLSSKARKSISVVARKSFPHRKQVDNSFNSKKSSASGNARKTLSNPYRKKSSKNAFGRVEKFSLNNCPVCYEDFPDTFTFYQHQKMTNHWGRATKSFTSSCKCPICGKEFLHLKSRNAHLYNHTERPESEIKAFLKSCTCNVCSLIFASESAKLQHVKEKHTSYERSNKKYSPSNFESNKNYDSDYSDKHKMSSVPSSVKKKLKQQPNTCPVCSKGYSHTVLRNKHFNEVHLKIFECQFCNTKFKSTSSLSNHIKLSHGKSLDCKDCKSHFRNELELLQHAFKYHPDQDPKSYLPFKFERTMPPRERSSNSTDDVKVKYAENVGFNSQKRNSEFYCDVCNIGYQKLCGLQSHRQSKRHKDTLVRNLDAFHKSLSDLPPSPQPVPREVKQPEILTCSECSTDFTSIKDFVPHRLSHFSFQGKYLKISELNPYMCEICSDVLDTHSKVQLHLFWHLQIESTSDKNTSVASIKKETIVPDRLSGQHVAKKSFSRPSNESLQEVVIGGVKKPLFTCEACNVGFTAKESYNMHVRKLCKKLKPSKNPGSEIDMNKNSLDATEVDILHCGNCNFLFSSVATLIQHKEFCVKCSYDGDSEENLSNSNLVKSALSFGTAIVGCITCAALFDNISGVAAHMSSHQKDEIANSEEVADVLHCALCNCLFSLDAFKMHKEFCKIPMNVGGDIKNSKHTNVLKSALELKCAVAACIACGLTFDYLEEFSKHLNLHQRNQIQGESSKDIFCNGEASASEIQNDNALVDNPTDSMTGNVLSDDQEHADSPLDFNSENELTNTTDCKSMISDAKQNSEMPGDIEDLRKNFSQLLCLLISDQELMQKLGFGKKIVDEVLVNVLQQMGQDPHTDESPGIDLLRKNIMMFLDVCLKDQVLLAIGKEKSTDEIVVEALKIFASEDSAMDP